MPQSISLPACISAGHDQGYIRVAYSDGTEVRFSISDNRRLRGQPAEKLNHIELGHFGISWPDLNEDLSHAGLLAGRFGQS